MAVRLDNLKLTSIEEKSLESGYLYKDVKFDLEMTRFGKSALYSEQLSKILTSYKMVSLLLMLLRISLQLHPGQKLLNPTFGLDFRSYLFEPINTTTAYFLAQFIYSNLGVQEPRITLRGYIY